jgi:hypothetical protein
LSHQIRIYGGENPVGRGKEKMAGKNSDMVGNFSQWEGIYSIAASVV